MAFAVHPSRGTAVVAVPTEHVHMSLVDLPLPSARKRLAAAPFAIEERLAAGLDGVHVALGPAVAPNRYVVAAVSHEQMSAWVAALEEAGIKRARLVPDAMTVPPNPDGWSVWALGDRALVRRADGTAFATANLPLMWRAAGEPMVRAFGQGEMPGIIVAERLERPQTPSMDKAVFDLRQGKYAPGGEKTSGGWLRAAMIALAAGGLAHGAIDIADARAVQARAYNVQDDARRRLARIMPDAGAVADPVAALARMVPSRQDQRQPGFLDLFARTSKALADAPSPAAVIALAYTAEEDALILDLDLSDLPALQQVGEALTKAGLAVESGPASTANGATRARIVVRGAGS